MLDDITVMVAITQPARMGPNDRGKRQSIVEQMKQVRMVLFDLSIDSTVLELSIDPPFEAVVVTKTAYRSLTAWWLWQRQCKTIIYLYSHVASAEPNKY